MKHRLRRLLAFALTLAILLSMGSAGAWAAETEDELTEAEDWLTLEEDFNETDDSFEAEDFNETDVSSEAEDELPTEDFFLEEEVVEESITEEAMMAVASASYLDAAWNDTAQKVDFTEKTAESCTTVTSEDTEWTDGWYVVDSNVTVGNRITVTGEVHLILADGAKLTASSGITVTGGNTLKIYGQSGGTGTLDSTSSGSSAIGVGGGWGSPTVGDIVIYGGKVTATGNTGIGYSTTRVNPLTGTLTIYGGTVVASTNADGAGIGGAWNDGGLKTVTVYGGEVTANGGVRAAAIGGGCQNRDNPSSGKGGDVYIYGGTVTAKVKDGTTYGGEGKTPVAIGRGDGGSEDGSITIGKYVVLYGGTSESDLVTIASPYTARYKYMKAVYVPPVATVTSGGTSTDYADFTAAVSAWNSADNGSTLTLLKNMETGSTITVSGTKTLDLNGYGIKFTGNFANSNSVIFIRGNGNELTLKDSRPNETTHYFTAPASGAGLATDISDTNSGSQQSFHGGYLTGGNCFSGGGIRVDGGGKLFMQGGTIIGNQGQYGGGMDVERSGSAGGSAVITGGVIMYNYGSEWTGGIHTNHANSLSISNCTITNNAAKNGIGGINWEMENDSATMSCSGNTVIENNMAGGTESNVCLASGKYISVSGTLSGGASIGVTMASPGVFTNSANTDHNDAGKFSSDSAGYAVGKDGDGQLYLGSACSVTYKVVNGTWSDDSTADKTETVASGAKPASVPTGMKASEGYTGGAWDTDPAEATITGATTFTYTFEAKTPASVTKAPEAKTLTYDGAAQELVSAGTAEGGTMRYALGTNATTAPTEGWDTSIPTGTNAGTCYVWYKVAGDANHTDTDPASISVTIARKEVGLSWSDTSFTYDGQSHIPTATATGLADGDACEVTVEGGQTNAGTYTATATALSNDNYKLPDTSTASFTIEKAEPGTPQVTMQGYTYGGTLPTPSIGDYDGGGAVTWYYSTSDSNSGGTVWTDSMTATSLYAGTYYMYAVIAPTENYLGYTTAATGFEIAPGVVTVSGFINFGTFSGTLTLSLLSSDGEETVASDSISVSGGKGTYHFEHITQGQYILRASWSEGGAENVLNDELEIR